MGAILVDFVGRQIQASHVLPWLRDLKPHAKDAKGTKREACWRPKGNCLVGALIMAAANALSALQ
jgi:hypothetical protein